MTEFKKKKNLMEWWMNASAATFGTILGIVLTVGVTYWQQLEEQEDMTHKIAKITLHNIDVRILSLKERCRNLMEKDSLFWTLQSDMPDKLERMDEDSLSMYLSMLTNFNIVGNDTKSENIFSNSFEVWKYLDDEKVIGRISNCYSFIDVGERDIAYLEQKLKQTYYKCCEETLDKGIYYDYGKFMKYFLSDSENKAAYFEIRYVYMLYQMLGGIQELNDVNKNVLGISQQELNALSNLLGDDTKQINYKLQKDSLQIIKNSIVE